MQGVKNSLTKMKLFSLGFILGFIFSILPQDTHAGLISVAKIKSNGGYIIFELYDDPAVIPECKNLNASGAIANLQKDSDGQKIGYGTGCWKADANGYVSLYIKSFDDTIVRQSKIHNSKFKQPEENDNLSRKTQVNKFESKEDEFIGNVLKKPATKNSTDDKNKVEISVGYVGEDSNAVKEWDRIQHSYLIRNRCREFYGPPKSAFELMGIQPDRFEYASIEASKNIFIFAYKGDENVGFIAFSKTKNDCAIIADKMKDVGRVVVVH